MAARKIGNVGEDIAIQYLQNWGYNIIKRNYTIRGGEIDIICQKDGVYFFVEVKYRRNERFGHPLETITNQKIHTLERTMLVYCLKYGLDISNARMRLFAILEDGHARKVEFLDIE